MKVGQAARRMHTVTTRDIELFTEMTGDRNPLHYDEQLAAASRFGGIIVQGGVTSGLLNALVAQDLPGPGSVFLHVDWSFKAPVRPGDHITAEAKILEIRDDKPICFCTQRSPTRTAPSYSTAPPWSTASRSTRRIHSSHTASPPTASCVA